MVADTSRTLQQRWKLGVGVGLLLFALDWSGYDSWQPALFFPKPLSAVWWHLPIWVAVGTITVAVWRR